MQASPSNREILSVSDLTKAARRLLEGEFPTVFVEGEISNFSTPASGHWYLTLKDDKSQLRCAMFKNRNRLMRFVPRNGLQVIVRGRISLYEARGEFQMIAEFMEEAGDGALRRAFEKLKSQLQAEGLFDTKKKKNLPGLIQHLAIVTSPTGAAVRDVLHVLKRRFPAIRVSIIPVQVQGEESTQQIVEAIAFANRYEVQPFDTILLTRGGGSLEDLWSFNTEPVARAIFDSDLPVVAAVGHETDISIADFVADIMAPTPSAAAELISPDLQSWFANLSQIERTLTRLNQQVQLQLRERLKHLQRRMRHPGRRLQDMHQRLDDLEARLRNSYRHYLGGLEFDSLRLRLQVACKQTLNDHQAHLRLLENKLVSPGIKIHQQELVVQQLEQRFLHQSERIIANSTHRLTQTADRLDAISPLRTLDRGYAIVTKDDEVVKAASALSAGDKVRTRLKQGEFTAEVTETKEDNDI
ncbi:MAG TPA: exodeoxyribonuclease VII large subunit [Pseudomonadales bacterium]|jgi:exodeoxyribonuclease VII large subunit|nr:exodeoxyribonuclease VII large subunit [Pseudomonadales bacterium]MDP6267404.1 exodeoxyribonuclease VII large subunit [Arenicellales bacterium]MDP7313176.1 exodeoxyribonuclease VII large subunit [Pseudomonadales bacterium]MDP7452226.1 exodeoxyribonuclease VII large subunit [Arenicellales bacterium]MDP7576357.1 exodeoxyribonuclease VII large subunit [Pseudomonadales bacterium]|tara:strand:- start:2146 stop:3555 length:1410 start_codon:yes stop_codon:yes gene_type:complete